MTAERSSGGGVLFSSFKPVMFYVRSYPKNDDDDDAKELVFLDGRLGLYMGVLNVAAPLGRAAWTSVMTRLAGFSSCAQCLTL